jgi:hypothetical protein
MKTPIAPKDYLEMIDQALFEVADLRESLEYDGEGLRVNLTFIETLEKELQRLKNDLQRGTHIFDGQNLPFMAIVHQQKAHILTFKRLLEDINTVHLHPEFLESFGF